MSACKEKNLRGNQGTLHRLRWASWAKNNKAFRFRVLMKTNYNNGNKSRDKGDRLNSRRNKDKETMMGENQGLDLSHVIKERVKIRDQQKNELSIKNFIDPTTVNKIVNGLRGGLV